MKKNKVVKFIEELGLTDKEIITGKDYIPEEEMGNDNYAFFQEIFEYILDTEYTYKDFGIDIPINTILKTLTYKFPNAKVKISKIDGELYDSAYTGIHWPHSSFVDIEFEELGENKIVGSISVQGSVKWEISNSGEINMDMDYLDETWGVFTVNDEDINFDEFDINDEESYIEFTQEMLALMNGVR